MGAPWKFIAAVQGVNAGGPSVATVDLTKTGGVASTWDSGARSTQVLTGDGFLEFTVDATGKYRAVGLSAASSTTSINFNTIAHGIYLKGGGTPTEISVVETGSIRYTGTYAVGDVFRIERTGTTIRYYKNGEIIWASLVAASGSRMIDAAFFDSASVVGRIRLDDATTKTFATLTWTTTNTTATAGTAVTTRRVTFATPTTVKAGDMLVAVFGGQGPESVQASSVTWAYVDTFVSATSARGLAVYRRIATDSEPTSYTFDLATQQETLGALLVYRDLDAAITLTGSLSDIAATTGVLLPVLSTNRLTDLYLGGLIVVTPGAATATPAAGANERIEFNQSALGINTVKLELLDATLPVVGKVSKRVTLSSSLASSAFSLLLGGGATFGADLAFSPIVPGAIGLPVVGI